MDIKDLDSIEMIYLFIFHSGWIMLKLVVHVEVFSQFNN